MSRLCVFYALQDAEICKLREMPPEERYDYMLEEIEPALLGTDAGYEMDKAWEGVQYCLGGGVWSEENRLPGNVVFGGEFLVDTDEEVITMRTFAGSWNFCKPMTSPRSSGKTTTASPHRRTACPKPRRGWSI